MATTASRRQVKVHGAEVSTDHDSLRGYAETIAMLLALAAVLSAGWLAMTPSEGADLTRPATVINTPSGEFTISEQGTAVQPDPDAAGDVAVIVPGAAAPDAEPTFGDPFGTVRTAGPPA